MISVITANAQTKVDTLTNEKIIQLSKIGLQPTVIITKIQNSAVKFDVSTDGLIHLSNNGVAAEVITEMMRLDAAQRTALAEQRDMRDPKSKRAMGIYYFNPLDSIHPIKRVDPTVTGSNKTGGGLGSIMTNGIASTKVLSTLSGAHSRLNIDTTAPVFYFYFDKQDKPGSDNWFFASATSPNEFALVKLTKQRNSREMTIASENNFGESSGIPDKVKVAFEYTEEAEGIYKVTFKQPLAKGEYCFVYASASPTSYSNDKVFDFSIRADQK